MPSINPGAVLWKVEQDKVTALQVGSGTFYQFNGVGSAIWQLLAEGKSRDVIVDSIATRYDAPRERIVNDVDDFIKRMLTNGILEP